MLLVAALIALSVATVARNVDYQSEIKLWASVLRVRPNNVRAMQNLAQWMLSEQRIEEGRQLLFQAEKLAAHNPMVQAGIGRLRLIESEDPDLSQPQRELLLRQAVDRHNRAMPGLPRHPTVRMNMGVVMERLGDLNGAIRYYRAAIRLGPGNSTTHKNLGHALVQVGKIDEGIQAYHEALKRDPNYLDAHVNLGIALAVQKKFDSAIHHFLRANSLQPDNITVLENLGQAYDDAGRYSDADMVLSEAFNRAVRQGQHGLATEIQQRREILKAKRPESRLRDGAGRQVN